MSAFGSAVEGWLAGLEGLGRSGHTIRGYRVSLGLFEAWCAARGLDPARARRGDVQAWVVTLGDCYGPATVQARLAAVRSFGAWCAAEDPAGPGAGLAAAVIGPRLAPAVPRVLDPGGVRRLVDAAVRAGARDGAVVSLLAHSGARASEVAGLEVAGLDLAAGWGVVAGKGGKTRWVPVAGARAEVEAWLGARSRPGSRWLFASSHGGPMRYPAVRAAVAAAAEAAGLEGVTPHVLRASLATRWHDAGVSPVDIQRVLGHANATTTGRYIATTPARVVAAAAADGAGL